MSASRCFDFEDVRVCVPLSSPPSPSVTLFLCLCAFLLVLCALVVGREMRVS